MQAISKAEFYNFLETAPIDPEYMIAKVIAIVGIHGLLRLNELKMVQWDHISLGTTSNKNYDGTTETLNSVSIKVIRYKTKDQNFSIHSTSLVQSVLQFLPTN